MRKAIATISVITLLASSNAYALPTDITKSLEAAYSTGDKFIIKAVVNAAKAKYPKMSNNITNYKPAPKPVAAKKKEKQKLFNLFTGNIEAGATVESGNTDSEKGNIAAKLDYEKDKWGNTLTLKAYGTKENAARSKEEYRVNNQTRYNLSNVNYIFGELDYVNDRFSGYDYRISELLGYGHQIIKRDNLKVNGEVSLGARQSSLENGDKENAFLGKIGGKLDWKITDSLNFTQSLSSSIGSDATITNSESALKSNLTETLYLKLGLDIEHISDVPVGRENTDIITKLNLGYDF